MMTHAAQAAKDALLEINSANVGANFEADNNAPNTNSSEALACNPQALINTMDQVLPFSDFVCRVCEQQPVAMRSVFDSLADGVSPITHENYLNSLKQRLHDCDTEPQMLECIRTFRHFHMAAIACLDILHRQNIQQSMQQVSLLADAIIEQSYLWLYRELAKKHGEPAHQQHLQIIAMGKLGGHELNYSSDIDLIFTYPETGTTTGEKRPIEHQVFFTRLAQKLIYALDHISAHGRCYRVDMRLRPMGDSGPLVISYAAFETYYQEQGRAWERYAMQKMRIVNHNAHSDELYDLIRPFVYRRYMDFTTLESIREMKVLIEKEVRRRQLTNNIKLGRGGIREVEFFAQSLQLIHAGREPSCQQAGTLATLYALYELDFIDAQTLNELKESYLHLRQVEHFLQMFNDEQTQTLPAEPQNQERLYHLLGAEDFHSLLAQIDQSMDKVHTHFLSVVQDANTQENTHQPHSDNDEYVSMFTDLWDIPLEQAEAIELLEHHISATSAKNLFERVTQFKQKLQQASVSERGMKSINRLMPLLLCEFEVEDSSHNHNQVKGIFRLLHTIVGRITYIDLLLENPAVRQRLFSLSKKSPWVTEQISLHPILLDELLHPVYLQPDELSLEQWQYNCAQELKQFMLRIDPDDIEAVMDMLRQFKHAYQLRIAASDISGTLAINKVSDHLTLLAQVILAEVLEQAWRQVTLKHGVPEGQSASNKGFGIVAYGKFGGIELSYGSDLDIVCLYNANQQGQTDDTGLRSSVSHQEFYIKLVQRITHYCITKTYHGILYDIDLRLRPSGNSGLLISHVDSFAQYQSSGAWTWEHQALVRARCVIGDEPLQHSFNQIRLATLQKTRDKNTLRTDVFDMREKMRGHLNKSSEAGFDIKQGLGGIVDIEFLVQFWVLNHCAEYKDLAQWSDNLRILDACKSSGIITHQRAERLQAHYLWLRHLAHRLQLSERSLASPSDKLSGIIEDITSVYENTLTAD